MTYTLSIGQRVRLTDVESTAVSADPVAIDDTVRARVQASRRTLEKFVAEERVIYGVNTSMGGFVNYLVPVTMARQLQENLLNAVATNVGDHLDDVTVRAIMTSRIVSLSRGNSAISLTNLDKLIAVRNSGVIPCVPEKGRWAPAATSSRWPRSPWSASASGRRG